MNRTLADVSPPPSASPDGVSPWRGSCPPRRQVQLPEAVILRDGGEQLASRHGNGCQSAVAVAHFPQVKWPMSKGQSLVLFPSEKKLGIYYKYSTSM